MLAEYKTTVNITTLYKSSGTRMHCFSPIEFHLHCLFMSCRAKRRRCNEAYVGTLSSYAYVLLCISHLQARSPPVLPVLQELKPFTHHRTIGELSVG